MPGYDTALKLLLQSPASVVLSALNGAAIRSWLNVEVPKMQSARLDLLGQERGGGLVHIEIQSTNDSEMALRMAEYCLYVYRKFSRFPHQTVLYVGQDPMRMKEQLSGERVSFAYDLVDIRELDGDRLLSSEQAGDNVIAILAGWRDREEGVRRVLRAVAALPRQEREPALGHLLVLAGLRQLEETVEQEARKMPILNDIMDHKVLGREYKRGHEEGLREGVEHGRTVLRKQIEKRFGAIPERAEQRFAKLSAAELEQLSLRLLDAQGLEELLG
jgi:predicted transposase YdaD